MLKRDSLETELHSDSDDDDASWNSKSSGLSINWIGGDCVGDKLRNVDSRVRFETDDERLLSSSGSIWVVECTLKKSFDLRCGKGGIIELLVQRLSSLFRSDRHQKFLLFHNDALDPPRN